MNVIQVQSEPTGATCPNCGAEVALDQRYCLSCGRPCSPVRLAFLDVLQEESAQRAPALLPAAPNGYLPVAAPESAVGRLGRFSGLFGLLAVLLLTGVAGLLIGHWIGGGGSSSGPRVIKVEGLGGTVSPDTGQTTSEEGATTGEEKASGGATAKGTKSKGSGEKKEEPVSEEQETKAAKLAPAVKPSSSAEEKLSKLSGKQYEQEIEKVVKGPQPIETG